MNDQFKKSTGETIPSLIQYILNILDRDPNVKIYIGTDSQTYKRFTKYVIVIAFRYSIGRGVHCISAKNVVRKLGLDRLHERLLQEFELSIRLADWLKSAIDIEIEALEVDYNSDDAAHNKSHQLLSTARGWGEGLGYTVRYKPEELLAVKYADHLL